MAKPWPLLKLVSFWVLFSMSIPLVCGVLVAVSVINDELFGSRVKITSTGSVAREYEDKTPDIKCNGYGENARASVYINEGGGMWYAQGYMEIVFPINPSTGVFPFFETGSIPDGIRPDKNDFGIHGRLFDTNNSLGIGYSNMREGTITLESIRSGYHKRLKGHFEATFEDKSRDALVILKGTIDIATINKQSYCLR
jgi:hypothetical protein